MIAVAGGAPFDLVAHEVAADGTALDARAGLEHRRTFIRKAAAGTELVTTAFTELRDSRNRIMQMDHYDSLTNLPSRTLLTDHLDRAIAQAKHRNEVLGVCYLDLDGFQRTNDDWGHAIGDQLRLEVASRLQGCVGRGDTVAWLGGNEFVLLLRGNKEAIQIELAARRAVPAIAAPYRIGELDAALTASIGVTVYPQDQGDTDTLIRHAHHAMRVAKRSGRNRYRMFDADGDRKLQANSEILWRVEQGLAANEFCLHYQPKVDMRRGLVIGAEALIRWNHPEIGMLLPSAFQSIVENSPVSVLLGEWALAKAIQQMSDWARRDLILPVSVNISGCHLQHPDFAANLKRLLDECADIEPEWLEIEILETGVMENLDQISCIMRDCSDLGVCFSLDDFGTGFSSLTHFRRLPTQIVKIDRSFIKDILQNSEDLAIVEGVVGLARAFHREVIAEGVETVGHGVQLLRVGCDLAQGYAISPPLPAAHVPAWIEGWKAPCEWTTSYCGA